MLQRLVRIVSFRRGLCKAPTITGAVLACGLSAGLSVSSSIARASEGKEAAADPAPSSTDDAAMQYAQRRVATDSPFRVLDDPMRPRSDILMPTFSFFLPGLDQWWEGQSLYGGIYTGVAFAGATYASAIARANENELNPDKESDATGQAEGEDDDAEDESGRIDAKGIAARKVMLGGLLYQGSGGMSSWHSFRTAVRTRSASGQYSFLVREETPAEVMLAPLNYRYLTRTTTLVPLGIGAAIAALILRSPPPEDMERAPFTGADAFFTTAFSWNAATHEEAMFRGWIMPVMAEYWDSPLLANVVQSVVFAAAHLNTNPTPLPQLLLGYHLGYVTQRDRWTIGEAVFIHHWWNVMAFATIWHFRDRKDPAALPPFWLPPLDISF